MTRISIAWLACAAVAVLAGEARADLTMGPLTGTTIGGVRVGADGTVEVHGRRLEIVPAAYQARVLRAATEVDGDTLTVVLEIETPGTRHGKPVWDHTGTIAAKIDLLGRTIVWRHRTSGGSDRDWSLLATPQRLYVRERRHVVAVDRRTGAPWRLSQHHLRSILVPPIFDAITLRGDTLDVAYHWYDGEQRRDFAMEIDAATGLRVYRRQPYVAPVPQPVYAERAPYYLEYPGDRPSPEVPVDWDAYKVGYAYVMWSKKTGEGMVLDPTANDAKVIIEFAKKQRDRAGKPIRWLGVWATRATALAGATPPAPGLAAPLNLARRDPLPIGLTHEGPIDDTGEVIDAATVAAALGAPVFDRARTISTSAGALTVTVSGTHDFQLDLRWGPYVFSERYYPSTPSTP